jgi:Bacteriophage protein gp37
VRCRQPAAHLSNSDEATGSDGGITASLPVLPNVWLGTSVESADYLGRIDDLRKVDAAVRFVSFEPLLGSVARADLRASSGHRRRRERPAFASDGGAVGRGD